MATPLTATTTASAAAIKPKRRVRLRGWPLLNATLAEHRNHWVNEIHGVLTPIHLPIQDVVHLVVEYFMPRNMGFQIPASKPHLNECWFTTDACSNQFQTVYSPGQTSINEVHSGEGKHAFCLAKLVCEAKQTCLYELTIHKKCSEWWFGVTTNPDVDIPHWNRPRCNNDCYSYYGGESLVGTVGVASLENGPSGSFHVPKGQWPLAEYLAFAGHVKIVASLDSQPLLRSAPPMVSGDIVQLVVKCNVQGPMVRPGLEWSSLHFMKNKSNPFKEPLFIPVGGPLHVFSTLDGSIRSNDSCSLSSMSLDQ